METMEKVESQVSTLVDQNSTLITDAMKDGFKIMPNNGKGTITLLKFRSEAKESKQTRLVLSGNNLSLEEKVVNGPVLVPTTTVSYSSAAYQKLKGNFQEKVQTLFEEEKKKNELLSSLSPEQIQKMLANIKK